MQDKRVVLIGATSPKGIGHACARLFTKHGAQVYVFCQASSKSAAEAMQADGICADSFVCDVTDPSSIESAFSALDHATETIDCVVFASVGNASLANIADPRERLKRTKDIFSRRLIETSVAERQGFCTTSAEALVTIARLASVQMKTALDPNMVVLSYLGATRYVPQYIIGPAKAYLEALALHLGGELGKDGIRMNVVRAGPIRTVSTLVFSGIKEGIKHVESVSPLPRTLLTEDVASTVLAVASPLMKSVTCEIINVDNGFHALGVQAAPTSVPSE